MKLLMYANINIKYFHDPLFSKRSLMALDVFFKIKSGSLNGTSYAAVRSIFSTRVHVLTQPPNRPTTFVDAPKIVIFYQIAKRFETIFCK